MKTKTKKSGPLAVRNVITGEIYVPTGSKRYIDGAEFTEVFDSKKNKKLIKSDALKEFWGGIVDVGKEKIK